MKEKMISATKLKAIIKGLPNDLLLECTHLGDWMDYSHLGDMMIRKKKDDTIIDIGFIDFETGKLRIYRCPICAVNLELIDTKGKRRCSKCKSSFQG